MGKSSMNGPFSMAMLNYQRVIWHVLTHAAEVSSAVVLRLLWRWHWPQLRWSAPRNSLTWPRSCGELCNQTQQRFVAPEMMILHDLTKKTWDLH